MSTTGHDAAVDPQLAILSLKQTETLQAGIRNALVTEAMEWIGDYRVPVWMALISAAQRMGITITKDELYAEQAASSKPEGEQKEEERRHLWDGSPTPNYRVSQGDNAEFSGVPAGHSSNHPAGGTSAATHG